MYKGMSVLGLQYGPAFQAIETLHCGEEELKNMAKEESVPAT